MESAISKDMKSGGFAVGAFLEARGLKHAQPTTIAIGKTIQQVTKV
jgi:hypothetical protein